MCKKSKNLRLALRKSLACHGRVVVSRSASGARPSATPPLPPPHTHTRNPIGTRGTPPLSRTMRLLVHSQPTSHVCQCRSSMPCTPSTTTAMPLQQRGPASRLPTSAVIASQAKSSRRAAGLVAGSRHAPRVRASGMKSSCGSSVTDRCVGALGGCLRALCFIPHSVLGDLVAIA